MNQEITKDIVKYAVAKAHFSLDNIETGFLTGQYVNTLPKDVLQDYLNTVQSMIIPYIQNLTYDLDDILAKDDCVMMFQYIFDRSFEISYKLIIGQKAYTVFEADETGDYYELDVPEHIQLKVQNIVPKVIHVSISSYNYMEDNGYISDDYDFWLLPFLFGASSIAMSYALEMDINDDSEMEQYLKDL